jgi:potassium large conductance calcium-activated channel subfamily M alpha protein 1
VGKRFSNLLDLILPLRSQSLGYIRPIVILTPVPLPADTWNHICIFQGIFVMHGSGLEEQDLVRAGIFKAAQCIFLSDTEASEDDTKLTSGAKAQQAALMDADGIFVFQSVMAVNPQINICVEIVNSANVGFLDPKEGLVSGDVDYKFTPQFASGALLTSSLLDTLICQAFYNRSIVAIIQLFAAGVDVKDKDTIRAQVLAGGNPNFVVEPKRGVSALVGSALYQMKIPEGEVRTYGEMFKSLCNDGILPLGLYRGVFKNMNVGPKQNKMPYVFTNPPKETELFSCDKVFVLSQKPLMGKRTVSKRSDWSLIKHTHIEPMDVVKSEAAAFEARSRAALDRVESRLGDVVQALAEVAGKEQFNFQRERQQEEDAAYELLRAKHT